jgi:ADP-ribosylglycohydrolase
MRICPLIIYASSLLDPLPTLSKDISLTHHNPIVHSACHAYSLAIIHLLNNPTSPTRA